MPRGKVLAYMRRQGIGVNSTHEAAALLGVPTNVNFGKPCTWELPPEGKRIQHMWTVLLRIEMHGPELGKEARHERGQVMPRWREGYMKSKNMLER
jgi:hypothetical protein